MGTATRRRLRNRNESSSLNLPVDRFLLPSCFPLGLAHSTPQKKKCNLLPASSHFFFVFLAFLTSFAFFVLFFFHTPPPLPLSACLLPNEALRIKCLKDCRHFRRFGRHATVHSSLRCSSDDCQTCEEHFEASVCEG